MSVRSRFRKAELEAIRQATARAEQQTGVEIVVVVVERCDAYPQAVWMASTLGALAGAVVAAAVHLAAGVWAGAPEAWILFPPFAGAALGYLAAALTEPLRRVLVPDDLLQRRAERRAAQAFVEEEVFDTVDRTGLLLLVALFEHRAVVLADRGLNERVEPGSWDTVALNLATGISRGRPAPAVVEAVEACGRLAAAAGLGRRDDDRNELADRVRFPDE